MRFQQGGSEWSERLRTGSRKQAFRPPPAQSRGPQICQCAAHQTTRLTGAAEHVGWHAHQELDEGAMSEWMGVVEFLQRLRRLEPTELAHHRQGTEMRPAFH